MRKRHRPQPDKNYNFVCDEESKILKKYAAPESKNFLYFDRLQRDFFLKDAQAKSKKF